MQQVISHERASEKQAEKLTRALLACGVASGPLFYIVAAAQMFTRPGFDIRHHAISLLSLGDLGWVQTSNFILTGVLALLCAVGMSGCCIPVVQGRGDHCSLASTGWV
jgi:hypothetical protein